MIMNKNQEYYVIREGISLHFWGDESIITDDMGFKYKLNEVQTDIIVLCTGQNKIEDIICKILELYDCTSRNYTEAKVKIVECIKNLHRNKLIDIVGMETESNINFSGEKGKYYPMDLSIEVTNLCNFKCNHCYKDAYYHGNHIEPNIIKQINKKYSGKIKTIQLTGGEPFLNPNIDNYIEKLSSNFKIVVVSNGTMICNHSDDILKKINNIQYSMYGCSAEEYYKFTHNREGWEGFCNAIMKSNELNLLYHLSVTLTKSNVDDMEKYVKTAISIGATRIRFGLPSVVGRALNDIHDLFVLSRDDINKAYKNLRWLKKEYYEKINVEIWGHVGEWNVNTSMYNNECKGLFSCGAGYMSYVISQAGQIRPCEYLPEEIFDMCDFNSMDEIIGGDFKNQLILNGIFKFEKGLNKCGKNLTNVCHSIQDIRENSI